jgi:hypothetical protein
MPVNILGRNLSAIVDMDSTTLAFKAVAGGILNRNRKTLIVGLASWESHQDWPLAWLHAVSSIKVL